MPSNTAPDNGTPPSQGGGGGGMPDLSKYLNGYVPELPRIGGGGLNWNNNPQGKEGLSKSSTLPGFSDYVAIVFGFLLIIVGIFITVMQTDTGKKIAAGAALAV